MACFKEENERCTAGCSRVDQEAECLRILTASDYFEVINIVRAPICVDDVRRQYRKVALRVHPDKNSCPDAEEAFKLLSTAYDCLSDEVQQRRYLSELQSKTSYEKHQQRGSNGAMKRSKPSSAFDFCTPTLKKWWEKKSWEEVEAFLKQQEALFEKSIQQEKEMYRERKQRKTEACLAHASRVRQQLAPLRAKYGLDENSSYAVNEDQVICYLCRRKFRNKEHLEEHKRWSKLHQQNLENDMKLQKDLC